MSEPEELEETAELSKSIIYEVKMTKNQSPGPMEEEAKPSRSVTPEGSHHGRITVASPGIQKSMIGEKLHPQVHKSQPDLAGRITGVLSEYNNADQLMQMLEGPEQNMTERIVEVLEALKGHGSSRAKSRAVKALPT
jgi:polyadenylate-binding protein